MYGHRLLDSGALREHAKVQMPRITETEFRHVADGGSNTPIHPNTCRCHLYLKSDEPAAPVGSAL